MTSRFDKWLADDEPMHVPEDEYDPPCEKCGQPFSDHPLKRFEDLFGNDYETNVCPPDRWAWLDVFSPALVALGAAITILAFIIG